ncbi:MAG: MBL fold metallo-hydrolase, partial [Ignavibacteriales bacterium]|nr:MBL fold metallo-hydrolase [Ignavibacteriales bacterium]
MTSRRTFLTKLGLSLLAAQKVFTQEERPRRSMISFLFNQPATAQPAMHPTPKSWDDSTITAAWIGHATVLINFFGTRIITDPVFSERIGIKLLGAFPVGPKRLVAPALSIDELPPIDLILLSHAHMDHLDFPSLRRFNKNIPMVVAKNTKDLLVDRGWKEIHELDWGERLDVAGVRLEALRVRHFGWRFPWESDRSRGDWNGRSFNAYLITKNDKNIVFGGDTAYQEYFKTLAERNIPIDLAILPIGAYDPWIHVHANP